MNKKTAVGVVIALVLLVSSSLSWGANQLAVVREGSTNNLFSAVCPVPCTFASMAYSLNSAQITPNSTTVPVVTGDAVTGGWIVLGTDTASGCLFRGTFDASGNFLRDWTQAGTCVKTIASDPIYFTDAPIMPCTSYSYTLGACQPSNTAPVTGYAGIPAGCFGGVAPATTQSCTYVPPTCTSFTYSAWGACQPNSTQTRTVSSSSPANCTGGSPVTSQTCIYVQPTNPCTSYTYTWGACQSNGTQTATSAIGIPAGCSGGLSPATTQSCNQPPSGLTDLGPEGQVNTLTIPGSGAGPWYGELDYYLTVPRNGSALVVNMSSTDWSTGQSVIVGLAPVTCTNIVGRGQFGPSIWSAGATPSNFVLTASTPLAAGQRLYLSVCNRSSYQGGFKLTWTESN